MKRRATAQLTRDGGYEPVPDPEPEPVGSSPLEIQKRVIYRARRPLRQPQFQDDSKVGFLLKSSLLSAEEEKRLLSAPATPALVDFFSVPDTKEIKEISPEKPSATAQHPDPKITVSTDPPPIKSPEIAPIPEAKPNKSPESSEETKKPADPRLFGTPLTSPAFKSDGFKSLIEELNRKKSEDVAATFINTKTPELEFASPRLVLPNPVEAKSVYKSEMSFACNGVDKGPGKLEVLTQVAKGQSVHIVVFRNGIGSIMYRGTLPTDSHVLECSEPKIELAENESHYTELEFSCLRKETTVVVDKCHVAVPKNALDNVKAGLEKRKSQQLGSRKG